ncbi:MAG: orotidine-5'-phosphate decarboxylase [Gemmatimonadaceae bacterium]|nr:orotidine-5'-phosphate decarboxylase [Gemmatimonadaceae bacterium]
MTAPALLLALDVPDADAALALVQRFAGRCAFYKVGLELFTAEGPSIVRAIHAAGAEVFLDLKLHDIPTTVRQAARRAAGLGVRLLTVHASGGAAMVAAAVEGGGDRTGIVAVTVLTSLDAPAVQGAWGRADAVDVAREVVRLSGIAAGAGAHGVVCSGAELPAVVAAHGRRLAPLVPGLRPAGVAADDQARVVTPAAAAAAGARYLILGRAVTAAAVPEEAWDAIAASVAGAAAG